MEGAWGEDFRCFVSLLTPRSPIPNPPISIATMPRGAASQALLLLAWLSLGVVLASSKDEGGDVSSSIRTSPVVITSPASCSRLPVIVTPNNGTSQAASVRLSFDVRTDACPSSPCCVMAVVSGPASSTDVWSYEVPPTPLNAVFARVVRVCSNVGIDDDDDDDNDDDDDDDDSGPDHVSSLSAIDDNLLHLTPGYYHVAAHVADETGSAGLPPTEIAFRVVPSTTSSSSSNAAITIARDAANLASSVSVKRARRAEEERVRREETTLTLAQYRRRHDRLWGPWHELVHPDLLAALALGKKKNNSEDEDDADAENAGEGEGAGENDGKKSGGGGGGGGGGSGGGGGGGGGGDDGGGGGGGGGGGEGRRRLRRLRGLVRRVTPTGLHALTVPILTDRARDELVEAGRWCLHPSIHSSIHSFFLSFIQITHHV